MTRDEQRKTCLQAMRHGYTARIAASEWELDDLMVAAFDALYGIAFLVPINPTMEMLWAGTECGYAGDHGEATAVYTAMCSEGDLINAPEGK
jgi:hypothetical protein